MPMRPLVFVHGEISKRPDLSHIDLMIYFVVLVFGPRSISELASMARVCRDTAASSCNKLVALGLMRLIVFGNRAEPVSIVPDVCQESWAATLRMEYDLAPNKGEFLMKTYLDLRIRSWEYIDNARPEFLQNPGTQRPLEYDRYYYRLRIAFEFNGVQHYRPTDMYDEHKVSEIILRDATKARLSAENGVRLIVVTAEQLQPRILDRLLPDNLPRRPLDEKGPYYRALNDLCLRHIRVSQQQKSTASSR